MSISSPYALFQRLCENGESMYNYWLIFVRKSKFSYFSFLIEELSHVNIDLGIETSTKTESGNPRTEKTCGFFSPIYSIKNKSIRGDSEYVQGTVLKSLLSDFLRGFNPRTDFLNPSQIYDVAPVVQSPGALACL